MGTESTGQSTSPPGVPGGRRRRLLSAMPAAGSAAAIRHPAARRGRESAARHRPGSQRKGSHIGFQQPVRLGRGQQVRPARGDVFGHEKFDGLVGNDGRMLHVDQEECSAAPAPRASSRQAPTSVLRLEGYRMTRGSGFGIHRVVIERHLVRSADPWRQGGKGRLCRACEVGFAGSAGKP